jgi:hypothetical protein
LVEAAKDKDEKLKAIHVMEFVLKQRAGSTATAPTYKLKVTRFCEGTVAEWIDFRKTMINGIQFRVFFLGLPLARMLIPLGKKFLV